MFNSHYIPVTVILKQGAIVVSHSPLFQIISKQAAVMVSHSHQLLFFGAHNLTPFSLALIFTSDLFSIKCCNLINKQASDWEPRSSVKASNPGHDTSSSTSVVAKYQQGILSQVDISWSGHRLRRRDSYQGVDSGLTSQESMLHENYNSLYVWNIISLHSDNLHQQQISHPFFFPFSNTRNVSPLSCAIQSGFLIGAELSWQQHFHQKITPGHTHNFYWHTCSSPHRR